jgi:hypothetical protein
VSDGARTRDRLDHNQRITGGWGPPARLVTARHPKVPERTLQGVRERLFELRKVVVGALPERDAFDLQFDRRGVT